MAFDRQKLLEVQRALLSDAAITAISEMVLKIASRSFIQTMIREIRCVTLCFDTIHTHSIYKYSLSNPCNCCRA